MEKIELLTRKEVAEMLKITLATLNGLVKNGTLQQIKIGKRIVRIKKSDVEKLIDATAKKV